MRKGDVSSKDNGVVMSSEVMSKIYSSPFPPSAEMERYEKICPGFTEKLLVRLEKQTEHRMVLEKEVIRSGLKASFTGQILGFILAISTIFSGTFLIYHNKDILGIAAIIGALVSLVGVFIYGNKVKKEERIQKAKEVPL